MQTSNSERHSALQQLLIEALQVGAEAIELEYITEGLEVSFMVGHVGLGEVISDRKAIGEIISEIFEQAKFKNKPHGTIQWTNSGKRYIIEVEEREHFGESAYKLTFKKPKGKHH